MRRLCRALLVVIGLLIGVAVADAQTTKPASKPAAAVKRPAPPAAEDWELPAAYLRDNGLRGDVVLNGVWRHTIGEDAVTRAFVPGGAGDLKEGVNRLYREFDLPAAWAGRRITLECGGINSGGELRVDGEKVADIRKAARFVEFPMSNKPGRRTMEIVTASKVLDDVWLRSYPSGPTSIDDAFILTSFRKKSVSVRLSGRGEAGQTVGLKIRISETADGEPVKEFSGHAVCDDAGNWSAEPAAAWESPRLWSRWKPNLYYYTVEATNAAGKTVDQLLPRRFGFREVWIEDGQFYINGVRTNYTSDSWGGQIDRVGSANPSSAADLMRQLKAAGQTFSHWGPRSEVGLNVEAEEGIMCFYPCGGTVRINVWDPRNGLTDMGGDARIEDILRIVRRLREQPSILAWVSSTAYSQASMHPELNARPFETWKYFPLNRDSDKSHEAQLAFKRTRDLILTVDPTRSVNCHNGPWTSVDMTTKYLTNNLDLQEREEFMEDWYRSDFKQVVSSTEVGMPFPGEYFLRKIDFQLTQTKGNVWRIFVESAARYFGDAVYDEPTDADIAAWAKTNSYDARADDIYQRLTVKNVAGTIRAWRTYGANFVGHHILDEDGFATAKARPLTTRPVAPAKTAAVAKSAPDPRAPGAPWSPGYSWPTPQTATLLPAGQANIDNSQPLLAYIGGADGRFTNKDHLYYAGAEVRKAAVLINDFDEPVRFTGEWRATDLAGTVVARGTLDQTVAAGQRTTKDCLIAFAAPAVQQRTDYVVWLDLKADRPGVLKDQFPITVHPARGKPALPPFSGTVYTLNISDDFTHETPHFIRNRDNEAFLREAGLDPKLVKGLRKFEFKGVGLDEAMALHTSRELVTDGTPKPGDLLIIPRHTLEAGQDERQLNVRLLEEMGLDKLVESGVRVLVMEQDLPNVFGLQTEDVRPRTAFIAAKGHPVFSGLTDADLSYWSGSSNLQAAVTPMSPTQDRFPERMWHVSNTNSVASRTFVRPQTGACRALAVSGFDLQESPLLEVTRGRGRMVFCQFDITNRYGKDPAATLLFDNVLRYLMTAAEPDPAKSSLGPTEIGKSIPKRHNLYRAASPEGDMAWGITRGELFFRESVYNNTYGVTPDIDVPVFAGGDAARPPVIRRGADGRLETTLTPDLMQTGWGKRKILWIRSALIVNQGGSSLDGPCLSRHGRPTDMYPTPWVEGFVHPYAANIW